MTKRVLIIGGHGYVGSVVTRNMVKQGHDVTVVDRQPAAATTDTTTYTHIRCSSDQMHDSGVAIEAFHVIIFLGGVTKPSAPTSMTSVYRDALTGFGRLVDELTSEQCLIYTSSAGVYGDTNGKMAEESDPLPVSINNYDYTKRCMDAATEMYAGTKQIYGLRLGSVCGDSPKFWKNPLLNAMVCNAVQERQVTVAHATKNRCILGFDDLCRVLNAIIDRGRPEISGIYNIGSFNVTVGDLAQIVVERYKCNLKTNDAADRSPYDFLLSTKKFENAFNFTFTDTFDSISLSLDGQLNQ